MGRWSQLRTNGLAQLGKRGLKVELLYKMSQGLNGRDSTQSKHNFDLLCTNSETDSSQF
jgi:hypothetical protein